MGLSTVAICPTSQSARAANFRPEIQVEKEETRVLCEMIRAIDMRRLGKRVGHLSVDEIAAVDDALGLVLELS
jgi:mRNA interferase MazF